MDFPQVLPFNPHGAGGARLRGRAQASPSMPAARIPRPEMGVCATSTSSSAARSRPGRPGRPRSPSTPASPRAGECFPIGAISARRPSTNAYVAVEDSFCFQITADDFLHLMQMSPVFHLFCTQYIASLLNQSRQQLQSTFSARRRTADHDHGARQVHRQGGFRHPDTPTRAALERMNAELHLGCMVVVDDGGTPPRSASWTRATCCRA